MNKPNIKTLCVCAVSDDTISSELHTEDELISINYSDGNYLNDKTVYLDKFTAIKFVKTIRTQIAELHGIEPNHNRG